MTDDAALLEQYVKDRSDRAFAALTERYASLVYSSALRQLRDPHLAQDITQLVFISLAKKAHTLQRREVLSAWLLTATRYEACRAMRSQARRQHHEHHAGQMGKAMRTEQENACWEEVAPLLDEAIGSLKGGNRDALLLRYFEQRSTAQVAQRLGISEEAARQRLSRAVEMLREFFSGRGITVSSVGVTALISAHAVEAAPVEVVAMAATAASAPGAATSAAAAGSGSAWVLAKGALIMAYLKTQAAAAAIIVALLIIGTTAVVAWNRRGGTESGREKIIVVEQRGANTGSTFRPPGPPETMVDGPSGVVVTGGGAPVANAEVMLATNNEWVDVYNTSRRPRTTVGTDQNGKFVFAKVPQWTALIARTPQGLVHLRPPQLPADGQVVIQPWGRVQGVLRAGKNVLANEVVFIDQSDWQARPDNDAAGLQWSTTMWRQTTRTDAQGRFSFDRVAPSKASIGREIDQVLRSGGRLRRPISTDVVDVASGQTTQIDLGGKGRAIVGVVQLNDGRPNLPLFAQIEIGPEARLAPSYPARIAVMVAPDGTFRAEDVPAGEHRIRISCEDRASASADIETIADGRATFKVPDDPADGNAQPLDIGAIALRMRPIVELGSIAPPLEVMGTDGKSISLSSYRGRYVLLRMAWAHDALDFDEKFLHANGQALADRLGQYDRLARINVILESGGVLPQTRPARDGVVVAMLKDWQKQLDPRYINSPQTYLIDPDGKVLAKVSRHGDFGYGALDKALGPMRGQRAGIEVQMEKNTLAAAAPSYSFKKVAPIAKNDAGAAATFKVIAGRVRSDSGGLRTLNDGRGASGMNEPRSNFFLEFGTLEGRLSADLGDVIPIKQINTYSWHKDVRAPQVYRVYGSDGLGDNFNPAPGVGVNPTSCGWTVIANVDTRDDDEFSGGQEAVSIRSSTGVVGHYRHLLFILFATEVKDSFGQTFYNEIDIVRQ